MVPSGAQAAFARACVWEWCGSNLCAGEIKVNRMFQQRAYNSKPGNNSGVAPSLTRRASTNVLLSSNMLKACSLKVAFFIGKKGVKLSRVRAFPPSARESNRPRTMSTCVKSQETESGVAPSAIRAVSCPKAPCTLIVDTQAVKGSLYRYFKA